jgi:ATP-dependent Clp protease ATP-binding subunit ClpA
MFERFSEQARMVVVIAQDEARTLRHNYIGSEHLLLGVARGSGAGGRALAKLGVEYDDLRRLVAPADAPPWSGQIPFTRRAREVLERALREALALGHDYIGTEHLLLGAVGDPESAAGIMLAELGVTEEALRAAVGTKPERGVVGARQTGSTVAKPSYDLDYETTVAALHAWNGRETTVVVWYDDGDIDRPQRGRLAYGPERSVTGGDAFAVAGVTVELSRDAFGGGRWVGGPEPGRGLSLIVGPSRIAVFPD